jgi:hypothetical protein
MHALVKKNENAERYSQNSCEDVQKELQHFVDPWPFRDADSGVGSAAPGRGERMFAQTPKFTYNPGKRRKRKGKQER